MPTLNYLAKQINTSVDELMEELAENGIKIQDPNRMLTPEQIKSIATAIENIKNSEEQLEKYTSYYKIFMDTSSLMEISAKAFYEHIYPLLKSKNAKIIIPYLVVKELYKNYESKNKEKSKKAYNGLLILKKLLEDGLIDIKGDSTDNLVDNVFLKVFTTFRLRYNMLLITQDKDLASDILALNDLKSVRSSFKIAAKKINKYGYLSSLERTGSQSKSSTQSTNKPKNTNKIKPNKKPIDKFKLGTKVKTLDDRCINITTLPAEDDIVISNLYGNIKLETKVASGGEGVIYTTNTDYVAKIYKREKLTMDKLEKIKLMISKKIDCKGICWPKDIIYNSNGEFVGYLMPKAKGKEMQKLFLSKPVLLSNMPNWKKRDTVKLSLTILEKIKYLHDRNIILGDINLMNILIVSPTEVYFVDTDSYQIEDFPCPVGTIPFTAQEILQADDEYKKMYGKDRKYSDYLRTFENEYFAVAVLLFMIMVPGKNPYSLQGGESIRQNILNMDFAYPLGEKSNKKAPDGPWKFIWSHMSYRVKKAFYHTFVKDGDYSKPETRLNISQWIKLMKIYLDLLETGELAAKDKMSEELFPTRRKRVSKSKKSSSQNS